MGMETLYPKLVELIPPALILGVFAYLVRFFGKAITDQKPFADNRDWDIELSGIHFFLNLILFPGVLGVLAATHIGPLGTGHWWRFIIVIVCAGWLWSVSGLYGKKVYDIKTPTIHLFAFAKEAEKNAEEFESFVLKASRFLPLWLFSIIFAYAFTLEYQSGSLGWMLMIGIEIFIGLLFMAIISSLMAARLPKIDIFFNDGTDPVKNVTLLKINNDNVRIKENGQASLLNRDQIKRIDFLPAE